MEVVSAIIVAAGSGSRMGGDIPKQFIMINGKTILEHTIQRFADSNIFNEIIVVVSEDYLSMANRLLAQWKIDIVKTYTGGKERFHTVQKALQALDSNCNTVFIHDAVRPFCREELLQNCYSNSKEHGSAIPAISLKDSIRIVSENGKSKSIDRANLRSIQTPQVFDFVKLRQAYDVTFNEAFTDDASVYEAAGNAIHLMQGESTNIKITTPDDLEFARLWL